MREKRLERMKHSRMGRFIRRMLGETRGAVMMEYVIVTVLIAAACVVAVAMFGKTIVGMFDVAAKGDHSGAKEALEETQQTQESDASEASEFHDSMHK